MIEMFKYVNHLNEEFLFGKNGIYVNENDLRDYSWSLISENNKISSFTKGIVTKTIPLVIIANSKTACLELKNRLFEVAEKDILAVKPGKIVVGNYVLNCYITGSKKSKYTVNDSFTRMSIIISTDHPYWIKESIITFNYGAGKEGTNLDYDNDFPMDYASNLLGQRLNNSGFVPVNFKMKIYGSVENPSIMINGHIYSINKTVLINEFLTIDSIQKTITLTHSDGTEENCFNLRNRDSYIFQKIPVGLNTVSNNGNFKFDVILLEERGEPKWT